MSEKSIAQDIKDTTEKVESYPPYLRTESSPARVQRDGLRDRTFRTGSRVVSIANPKLETDELIIQLPSDEYNEVTSKFPVSPSGELQ